MHNYHFLSSHQYSEAKKKIIGAKKMHKVQSDCNSNPVFSDQCPVSSTQSTEIIEIISW